ncbi:MAG: T9SS type A sorting domain-containing protein, partial [Saprospiraceae bacterium]
NVITLPFTDLFNLLDIENYTITLEEENSGNCFVVNVQEPLNDQVRIETSPNPFSLETNISIYSERVNEELQLEVFTMLGERVHSETINLAYGNNVIPFDGSRLSEGVYFFNFSDGNTMLTQKMIVAR